MAMAAPPVQKIQVESRGDILHLQRVLKQAARDRVEKAAVPEEDRAALASSLDQWVDEIFDMAGPNITVNGMEYAEAMQDKEEYEPKDERLDKLIEDKQREAEERLFKVTEMRRNFPVFLSKLAEDAERRKTWGEAEGIVFADHSSAEKVADPSPALDVDLEEMVSEIKETAEAVKEMALTVPALESKLANAHSVMEDLGLLVEPPAETPNKRLSIGGMVRAAQAQNDDMEDEPSTPRRAIPALVKKLRGSDAAMVREQADVEAGNDNEEH
ncbi:hypothetical protein DFJ74DRAFT_687277 [Hyaloraphidium curvatum]|nr:hypothetical protein DFJ74DRAFT_687277 [Hyaloraphidium curvatum]